MARNIERNIDRNAARNIARNIARYWGGHWSKKYWLASLTLGQASWWFGPNWLWKLFGWASSTLCQPSPRIIFNVHLWGFLTNSTNCTVGDMWEEELRQSPTPNIARLLSEHVAMLDRQKDKIKKKDEKTLWTHSPTFNWVWELDCV